METTAKMNLIPTFEKVIISDYPYGFNLRTSMNHQMEFSPKKGYRIVTTTINPKTGRLNNSKKSTYYALIVRYFNEDKHVKTLHFDFNGDKNINKACEFISANFGAFTAEEINYFYMTLLVMLKSDFQATHIYGGAPLEPLKPLYEVQIAEAVKGVKTGENLFKNIVLDVEKIKALCPEDFSPFR